MKRRNTTDTAAKTTMRSLKLSETTDAYNVPFGVLSAGTRYTVLVVITDPTSTAATTRLLARLPAWAAWFQTLGTPDRVSGASLSVETWETGHARATVGLSLSALPIPDLERKRLGHAQMLEAIATHMGRLLDGLRASSGGLDVKVCTSQDIIDMVRVQFDATIAADVESARATGAGTGLAWDDAPPRPETVTPRAYGHDRAVSMSWAIASRDDEDDVPVDDAVILTPTPGILGKRITRIFRMAPTADGCLRSHGAVVTVDVRAGGGAGTEIAAELPAHLSPRTRLRLRAATHTQDTTFLAGLPLDLAAPHTTATPRNLKEMA